MNISTSASERLAQSRAQLTQALRDIKSPAGQGCRTRPPLRATLLLASQAANSALVPTAQRHPFGLVLGAAAIGGGFVLARPWRWPSTATLVAGLLPQLMAEFIKRVPELVIAAAASVPHDLPARPASPPDR